MPADERLSARRLRGGWHALTFALALVPGAQADHVGQDEPASEPASMAERLEMSQAVVSERLDAFARKIDRFFDDERFVAEDAATRMRLGEFIFMEEGEDPRWRTRLNLSFRLPNLDRKVKLFFSGDEDDAAGVSENSLSQSIETQSNESLAGLRYFARATERLNLSMAVGVKVDGADLFTGPRLRYSHPLGDWLARFTQRVIWITDRGWESTTRVDVERAMSSRMLLRNTFNGRWREEEPGYRFDVGTTLFHQLPESIAMAYSWMHSFRTRPTHRYSESVVSVQFRRHIWRDWLFLAITPQLAFYEEDDFNPTAGISLGFEVIFGSK